MNDQDEWIGARSEGEEVLSRLPAAASLQVDVAAISDVGRSRSNNEDCFGYDLEIGLFLVCDGMGGMAGGEVASRIAVDQMLLHYRELRRAQAGVEESCYEAMQRSNVSVWTMAQEHRALRGMGTTMVTACLEGTRIVIGNIGDSRAYLVRNGTCQQVTLDHSYAAERARQGLLTEFEAGESAAVPQWITRAVGVGKIVEPDLFVAELAEQDLVLLASDGLTRYADPAAIAEAVYAAETLPEACQRLVAIAERGGAEDNVTCLLLRLLPG